MSPESQLTERYVAMHVDNPAVEEREDGIYVRCPYCGQKSHSWVVMEDGCECGAHVTSWVKYTRPKGGDDDD